MQYVRSLSLAVAVALFGGGCSASGNADPPVASSPGATARRMVADGAVLLDVRTDAEFGDKHLAGARNIPVEELEGRLAEVPAGSRVVVYCRSGRRSARAAEMLRAAGHEVFDLGPMTAW